MKLLYLNESPFRIVILDLLFKVHMTNRQVVWTLTLIVLLLCLLSVLLQLLCISLEALEMCIEYEYL